MTIVRVGSTQKYADGWETAFGKKKSSASGAGRKKRSVKSAKPAKKAKAKKSRR